MLSHHEAESCQVPAEVSYSAHIAPMMERYCTRCHAGDAPKAGFHAESYALTNGIATPLQKWQGAYRRVLSGTMPTTGDKPSSCETQIFKSWVDRGALDDAGPLTVDACAKRDAAPTELRRLTAEQYQNALRDLLPAALLDRMVDESLLAALPIELPTDRDFSSFERDVSFNHTQTYFDVASWLSDEVNDSTDYLAALEPCLAEAATVNPECRDRFVSRWGRRVYRRPLRVDEVSELTAIFTEHVSDGYAVGAVLFATLQSPAFLYHLETEGRPSATNPRVLSLSDHEVASRLAFLAWNRSPDAELSAAADDGALRTDAGLRQQVDRLFGDSRARPVVTKFFAEWLAYNKRRGSNFSDAFLQGVDVPALFQARRAEMEQYLLTLSLDDDGTYRDLLTSNAAFVNDPVLASVYGMSAEPQRTTFSDPKRGGLLTKAALLAGGDDQTHPVHRGVFIMRKLLCREIALPAADEVKPEDLKAPEFDPSRSSRERWTARTEVGRCASCHSQINPYGFLLEGYDSLGRARTTERIFDPTTHALLNELPVDDTVSVVVSGVEPVTLHGAMDLATALADGDEGKRCMTQQWFRYSYGRREQSEDQCQIAALSQARSVKDLWTSLALQPEFRQRRIVP